MADIVPLPAELRLLLDVADRHFAARLAMELFCFRLARDLDALCMAAEGVEHAGLVAGPDRDLAGSHPRTVGAIRAHLARLGLALDAARRRPTVAPPASDG